ncbi:hypothetical protein PO124_30785 [Bacillus licheniformis]|nr:hypothetical protein [Bacillus licheniformis]
MVKQLSDTFAKTGSMLKILPKSGQQPENQSEKRCRRFARRRHIEADVSAADQQL